MDVLKDILDNLNDSVVIVDPGGQIVLFNNEAERIQKSISDKPIQIGCYLTDLLSDDRRKVIHDVLKTVKRQKKPLKNFVEYKTPFDTSIFLEVNFVPVLGRKKELRYINIITQDITSRKLFEKKIKAAAVDVSNLLEQAHAVIFSVDSRGYIVEWNSHCAELTGHAKTEVLSRELSEILPKKTGIGVDPTILLDIATELAGVGELDHALALFDEAAAAAPTGAGAVAAMALYRRAQLVALAGRDPRPDLERARTALFDRAFPHGLDDLDALEFALATDESDGCAHALLGTLLYDSGRRTEALRHWRRAIELGHGHPVTLRNAAMATAVVEGDVAGAIELYERAIEAAPGDARLWYESDQLLALSDSATSAERLARIPAEALKRDDLAIEYAGLLVDAGRASEAVALLESRPFQPWEGGEGRAVAAWERACIASGAADRAAHPPASLGEVRGEPTTPTALREDGSVDYFATSLPDSLLFPGLARSGGRA